MKKTSEVVMSVFLAEMYISLYNLIGMLFEKSLGNVAEYIMVEGIDNTSTTGYKISLLGFEYDEQRCNLRFLCAQTCRVSAREDLCQPCLMLVVVPYARRCTVTLQESNLFTSGGNAGRLRCVVLGSRRGDLRRHTPAIAVTRAYACVCVCVRALLLELGQCLTAH